MAVISSGGFMVTNIYYSIFRKCSKKRTPRYQNPPSLANFEKELLGIMSDYFPNLLFLL